MRKEHAEHIFDNIAQDTYEVTTSMEQQEQLPQASKDSCERVVAGVFLVSEDKNSVDHNGLWQKCSIRNAYFNFV